MPTTTHIPTAEELTTRAPGQNVKDHYELVRVSRDAHYAEVQRLRRRSEISNRDLTRSEERSFRSHLSEVEDLSELLERIGDSPEARAIDYGQLVDARTTPDDDAARTSRGPVAELALRTVDAAHRAGQLPDFAAERVAALVEQGTTVDRSLAARWAVAAGAELYRSTFGKLLADPERGHLLWTRDEQESFQRVA